MAVIETTTENFTTVTSSGVALVKFSAPWCGPCRQLSPIIEKLAEDFDGKANICDLNIDDAQELAQQFAIRSIPTTVIFKDGVEVDRIIGIGMTVADALATKINNILNQERQMKLKDLLDEVEVEVEVEETTDGEKED